MLHQALEQPNTARNLPDKLTQSNAKLRTNTQSKDVSGSRLLPPMRRSWFYSFGDAILCSSRPTRGSKSYPKPTNKFETRRFDATCSANTVEFDYMPFSIYGILDYAAIVGPHLLQLLPQPPADRHQIVMRSLKIGRQQDANLRTQ